MYPLKQKGFDLRFSKTLKWHIKKWIKMLKSLWQQCKYLNLIELRGWHRDYEAQEMKNQMYGWTLD